MRAKQILIWTALAVVVAGCPGEQDPEQIETSPPAQVQRSESQEQVLGARTLRRVGRPMAIPEIADRPNVLMISLDNVRADRLSSYGNPRLTTPNLDTLATRGTRFTDCTAQAPFTPHSYASLFASLHVADLPVRERARGSRSDVVRAGLEEYHVTLPEMMQQAGYHTAAFVRGWFTPAFGLTQGFDRLVYESQPVNRMVDDSIRWLRGWKERASDRPFFLFSYAVDVHYRFMAHRSADSHVFGGDPEGYNIDRDALAAYNDGKYEPTRADLDNALTLYDEGLYWADQEIQPLIDELDALGIADSTIIVFVSDHGEEFIEHGYLSHGQSNFRTAVHVPLIIYDPRVRGPRVIDRPVMNIDVMPTLLDLCRIPIPESAQGLSLASLIRGHDMPPLEHRFIFSEGSWNGFVGLARAGRWAYLVGQKGQRFLFDYQEDPHEQNNLISELPALARQMEQVLFQHKRNGLGTRLVNMYGLTLDIDRMGLPILKPSELGFQPPTEESQLNEDSIEQLRALGYLN